jgi:hypothetical protein
MRSDIEDVMRLAWLITYQHSLSLIGLHISFPTSTRLLMTGDWLYEKCDKWETGVDKSMIKYEISVSE